MEQSISKLWCQVRERRHQRVLRALQRLIESRPTSIMEYISSALLPSKELTCAMKVSSHDLEPSWVLVRKEYWYPFGPESVYSPDLNGRNTAYIFVQVDWINKPKKSMDKDEIHFLNSKDTMGFINTLGKDFQIRQYIPLTQGGTIDGWVLYRYSGGTSEGILIFEEGKLIDIRKRPFGSTLNKSMMLRDKNIQEYLEMYNRRRGHYPTGEFDPLGSHSVEPEDYPYHYYDMKHRWCKYLWETENSRKIVLEYRECSRVRLDSETDTTVN